MPAWETVMPILHHLVLVGLASAGLLAHNHASLDTLYSLLGETLLIRTQPKVI